MTALNSAGLRAIVREVPDALRPTWMQQTWSGTHGTSGLRSVVNEIESNLYVSGGKLTGDGRARGIVRTAGDQQVGIFTRNLSLEDNGRLNVYHAYLRLDDSQHGSGFARSFNDQAFARYAQAGVDDVTITAALSVGGYAWARQGFELAVDGADDAARMLARGERIADLVDAARQTGRISEETFEQLAPRLVRDGHVPQNALTSVQELAALPDVGKAVLLGKSWSGIRPIERTAAWWPAGGTGGANDAAAAVSYLTDPASVAIQSARAGERLLGAVPAAMDPRRAAVAINAELAGLGHAVMDPTIEGAELTLRLGADDAITSLSSRLPLVSSDGVRGYAMLRHADDQLRLADLTLPEDIARTADADGAVRRALAGLGVDVS